MTLYKSQSFDRIFLIRRMYVCAGIRAVTKGDFMLSLCFYFLKREKPFFS